MFFSTNVFASFGGSKANQKIIQLMQEENLSLQKQNS